MRNRDTVARLTPRRRSTLRKAINHSDVAVLIATSISLFGALALAAVAERVHILIVNDGYHIMRNIALEYPASCYSLSSDDSGVTGGVRQHS